MCCVELKFKMGKRRKEGPQADKYNPHAMSDEEDEEEIENNLEKVNKS